MLSQIFDANWAWIIAGAVMVGLEIILPGVYLLWIGLGALLVGLLLTLLPDLTTAWQMTLFSIAMLASISLGFTLQRRSRVSASASHLNQELEAMRGQHYTALGAFEAGRGRVRVGDGSYAAEASDPVRDGDTVEVVDIRDGRLLVRQRQTTP
jgi:membrane protein implicated in regulation of membrane protease activity